MISRTMPSLSLPVPGRSSGTRPAKKIRFNKTKSKAREEAAKNKAKLKKLEERMRKLRVIGKDQKISKKLKPEQFEKGVDKSKHDHRRYRYDRE